MTDTREPLEKGAPESHGEPAGAAPPDSAVDRLREELHPTLEVIRELGSGSAATVYLAREPALRRLVAVKVLSPDLVGDAKERTRFEREAQAAARIQHPNVVAIYRVGLLSDDSPYIVMQYVKGPSFADRLRASGPLPEADVRSALCDVASALTAAHRHGIVHRDVKPANVLHEDDTDRDFLTDFGIAAPVVSGDLQHSRLTTRHHVVGESRYRSPEQLRHEDVTERADVYGLGHLGFELLTGESPFEAPTAIDWVVAHLHHEPRRPSSLREGIDPELESLLMRCLEKVPEHRPSAADVVRALSDAAPTPEPAARTGPEDRAAVVESPRPAMSPPADVVTVRLLGKLDVLGPDGGSILSVTAQPKRVGLLAYLAIGDPGAFTRRDRMTGVFWPDVDDERARHALRQALYVLRQGLGSDALEKRGNDEVRLTPTAVWCDVPAFETAAAHGNHLEALDWYAGELLPGFHIDGAGAFEHWLETERTRLRRLAVDSAWSLSEEEEASGNVSGAARWAQKAADLAPFDEAGLCRLLEVLDRLGDRAGALHAYRRFADRLAAEFDDSPAPDTRALARRLQER